MDKLLLVGAGGLGRVVVEHAIADYECAFVDDADIIEANGVPVIGKLKDIEKLYAQYKKLVVSIGNNNLRERVYRDAKKIGYVFPNIVVSSVYISPFAKIGNGCVFLNNVVIQNNAEVGNGVILNPGVEIHHDSVVGDNVLIYTNTVVRTLARIGNRAHIGSTLTISNGAVIGEGMKIDDGVSIM